MIRSIRPSGYFFRHLFDRGRAAGVHNSFLARQHHAELRFAAQHFLDHLLVAFLKMCSGKAVRGNRTTWSGKSGNSSSCMCTIMASYQPGMDEGKALRMILKLKRTPGLYLVGFMASGKTTIGRLLADELGWAFTDLDEDIEAAQGGAIVGLFDSVGEEEFRKTEQAAIRKRVGQVERGKPMVVALGGGTFVLQVVQEFLIENGITVWLDCPFERVSARIQGSSHRPLAAIWKSSNSSIRIAARRTETPSIASKSRATIRLPWWRLF